MKSSLALLHSDAVFAYDHADATLTQFILIITGNPQILVNYL